jgi:hypothetical protein
MRYTRKVSVWAVGTVGGSFYVTFNLKLKYNKNYILYFAFFRKGLYVKIIK